MTSISPIPQQKAKDSDDGQPREDLQEDNLVHRSASGPPPNARSRVLLAPHRRSTRQPATLNATSHTHDVLRSPVQVQLEHGPNDVVDPLPPVPRYDLRNPVQVQLEHSPNEFVGPLPPLPRDDLRNPVQVRLEHEPAGIIELLPPAPQDPTEALGPEIREVPAAHADILGTVVLRMISLMSILLVLACAYTLTPEAIEHALASWCSVPVVSPFCPASRLTASPSSVPPPQWADFPRLLNLESGTFEVLLDETVKGPGLALEMKQTEVALKDLATLVRISDLESREVLADSLSEFVKDARKVGRDLIRFNSRVGGAVDTVITVNDYALHTIEAASSKSSALFPRGLWPFSRSENATNQVIMRAFTEAMNTLLANLGNLVLDAEVSITDLNKLEERLGSIHEIVSRERDAIPTASDGTLGELWTIVADNSNQPNKDNKHLVLLNDVGGYRIRALTHVVAALQMLETMEADMEELRQRVAAPQLVGDAIPIDVHIKSIRSGLERLKGIRAGSK